MFEYTFGGEMSLFRQALIYGLIGFFIGLLILGFFIKRKPFLVGIICGIIGFLLKYYFL